MRNSTHWPHRPTTETAAQHAPTRLPPITEASLSWDGRLTVTLSCHRSPTDTVLLVDGQTITPDALRPAPTTAETGPPALPRWDLRFSLPADSTIVQVSGCDQPTAALLVAQPSPALALPVVGSTLLLLLTLLFVALRRRLPRHSGTVRAATEGWQLAVWDGRREWVVPLHGTSAILGHHQECDVPLIGPAVAARHVRLVREAEAVRLIDLGAAGGTFVGPIRRRLRAGESVLLHSDEEFVLGTSVRVRLQPGPGAPPG